MSVCLLVTTVNPTKADEPIGVPYGLWTRSELTTGRVHPRVGSGRAGSGRVTKTEKTSGSGRVGSDGSGFGDMQFAADYNNGITYVINV